MSDARDQYLQHQVMSATPQKLHLMLIEGAIRFSRHAIQLYEEGENIAAGGKLGRARECVMEMLTGIRPTVEPELTKKVSSVYLFIFNSLTEAQMSEDVPKIHESLKVLDVERETWKLLCEQMPHAPDPRLVEQFQPKEVSAKGLGAVAPLPSFEMGATHSSNGPSESRMSWEA
ncbi:MAG: flagellar protein FliS [Pirellulaceae bacterium]|jgi:flagellar protein FliS